MSQNVVVYIVGHTGQSGGQITRYICWAMGVWITKFHSVVECMYIIMYSASDSICNQFL